MPWAIARFGYVVLLLARCDDAEPAIWHRPLRLQGGVRLRGKQRSTSAGVGRMTGMALGWIGAGFELLV